MMKLRIFCSHLQGSAFAELAEWATGQAQTHAGIREDVDKTFEARGGGDNEYRWHGVYDVPGEKTWQWEFVGIPDDVLLTALTELKREWSGKRYGFGQLAAISWQLLRKKLGFSPGSLAIRRLAVCSELVWRLVEKIGGPMFALLSAMYPDADNFTPGDLAVFAGEASLSIHGMLRRIRWDR